MMKITTLRAVDRWRAFVLLLCLLTATMATAQTRYCATWHDYQNGNWKDAEADIRLMSSTKEDTLALTVNSDNKKMRYVLQRCFCMEHKGLLYLNLRPFNRFGDVFVRAWRMNDGKLLFARQEMTAGNSLTISRSSATHKLKVNTPRSYNNMENLVCYVAAWDERRHELRLGGVMQEQSAQEVIRLLLNNGTIK